MVLNSFGRFWMVAAGSLCFWICVYSVRWFWLVLDGGGRFLPTHRLFLRVLTLIRFFFML